jgi:hypothetical protein
LGRIRQAIIGRKAFQAELNAEVTRVIAEAGGGPIDGDEYLYRAAGLQYRRDLPEVTHDRSIEVAYQLYQQNPLAKTIIEMTRNFTVGDGVTYSVANPDVQAVVDEFWQDPTNNLDQRIHDWAGELPLFGELAPEAFVGDVSGIVGLGLIDPQEIRSVLHVPGNPLVADRMALKTDSQAGVDDKTIDIIRYRSAEPGQAQVLAGQAFYFRVNGVSNSTRGWSDLLQIADWLDIYDQMLWEMLQRAKLMRLLVWDVEIEGDQNKIDGWLARHRTAPRSGTINAHNANEKWTAVSPTLGAYEIVKEADKVLEHIAAGAGFPKTWFSSPESVNRASAEAMTPPTYRRLATRQRYFLNCIRQMVDFALTQATQKGVLHVDTDGEVPVFDEDGKETGETSKPIDLVVLNAPEISNKDMAAMATAFTQLSSGLLVAEQQGWVGRRAIGDVMEAAFAIMGIEYDPTDIENEQQNGLAQPNAIVQTTVDKALAAQAKQQATDRGTQNGAATVPVGK